VGSEFNAEIHIILPNETRLDETSKIVKSISTVVKNEIRLARVAIIAEPENN
jgi:divalent metal cation (Fe/Co/Zn/Cd) transporter